MDYAQVIKKLSACGLDCSRCADYEGGEIKTLSASLLDLLKGYERLAELKSIFNPVLKDYGKLRE